MHVMVTNTVDKIGESRHPKIYDISHSILPEASRYENISHLFTLFTALPLAASCDLTVVQEFLGYFVLIVLLRDFTISLTILPRIDGCLVSKGNSITGGCHDKIFSGHAAFTLLATLIMYERGIIKNLILLIILNVVNVLFILITRGHYTIDIVVSILVTFVVFQNKFRLF